MANIKKIIGAFVHAPDRFDELAGRIVDVSRNLDDRYINLNDRMEETGERINSVELRIDGVDVRTEGTEHRIEETERRFDETDSRFEDTDLRIDEVHNRIDEVNNLDDGVIAGWFMNRLCEDRVLLSRLNRGLSISPTVWGDPARLEIDETAVMHSCFFNTNSGTIRVGESSFAGSGVSILAGGHDPQLTGFLRKDGEPKEGYDIEVGKGVWLASGCMLLGPCRIGDNAVIAAGAVVTPGTEVPANEIWGGVPARKIGMVDETKMTPDNPAVKKAFAQSEGILFADGWGEEIPYILSIPGHWMHKRTAAVMTDKADWVIEYRKETEDACRIQLSGPEGEKEITPDASEGKITVRLPVKDGTLSELTLTRESEEKVFMAWMLPEAEAAEETPAATEAAPAEAEIPEAEKQEETAGTEEKKTAEAETEAYRESPLDIEKIMEEIRAEARKRTSYGETHAFRQISAEEPRKCEQLKEQVEWLTRDYVIPESYDFPSRNPMKRIYKGFAKKAMRCAVAPMSEKVTATNLSLKTALEKAVEVIEDQDRQLAKLEKRIEELEKR